MCPSAEVWSKKEVNVGHEYNGTPRGLPLEMTTRLAVFTKAKHTPTLKRNPTPSYMPNRNVYVHPPENMQKSVHSSPKLKTMSIVDWVSQMSVHSRQDK